MVTDDVAEFMVGKLQRLPASTQEVLRLAACIGHEFDRRTLSVICEQSPDDVASDLWAALQEGLVEPRDDHSGYLHDRARDEAADSPETHRTRAPEYVVPISPRPGAASGVRADSRISQRQEVHLRIGRLMIAGGGPTPKSADLFEIVNHMNIGSALVTDPAERRALARLNLAAGRRARDAAAYSTAVRLLSRCLAALGDDPWTTDYDIAFPASLTKAESASR